MQITLIRDIVRKVSARWTTQRKAEERDQRALARRLEAMSKSTRRLLIDAVYEFMEDAYLKASFDGKYPAKARQVYYPSRGPVEKQTGQALHSKYFSQTLIPRYLEDHPHKTAAWDIVFDARGHFTEPHTQLVLPLGTLDVRNYLEDVERGSRPAAEVARQLYPTVGPANRLGAVLFIEKEDFDSLFSAARLARRYDLAIMSTKGLSVTASRQLVDVLCGEHELRLFVLHDFDKAGFSIFRTLTRSTGRYQFDHKIEAIDLGIRLKDVEAWQLDSERVVYGKSDPTANLKKNGASDREIKFLYRGQHAARGHVGERVELNAFSSERFLQWIEENLQRQGVHRVAPDPDVLHTAYRREMESQRTRIELQAIAHRIHEEVSRHDIPATVERQVRRRMKVDPALPWDLAVAAVVQKHVAKQR